MKKLTHLLIATCLSACFTISAQTVKTSVTGQDWVRLNIQDIDAHAFPRISVSFKAERKNGIPVWDLDKSKIALVEDGKACQVISLQPVSKSKPIYVSLVIDHSGSMEEDPAQLYDKKGNPLFTVNANNEMIVPDDYTSPIDNAKSAIKAFTDGFDAKDLISVTGFGSSVDEPIALTRDRNKINATVAAMQPDGKTALYDGMMEGIAQVKDVYGIRVLVVLTDGQDNRSTAKWNEVINTAVKENVPVYIIGLGEVNKENLQQIAAQTNGQFFYTNSSESLQSIYATISQRVQSIFQLEYVSANTDLKTKKRELNLSADIKNAVVVSAWGSAVLPAGLTVAQNKTLVAQQQEEKITTAEIAPSTVPGIVREAAIAQAPQQAGTNGFWIYGDVAIALLATVAAAVYAKKRFYKKTARNKPLAS